MTGRVNPTMLSLAVVAAWTLLTGCVGQKSPNWYSQVRGLNNEIPPENALILQGNSQTRTSFQGPPPEQNSEKIAGIFLSAYPGNNPHLPTQNEPWFANVPEWSQTIQIPALRDGSSSLNGDVSSGGTRGTVKPTVTQTFNRFVNQLEGEGTQTRNLALDRSGDATYQRLTNTGGQLLPSLTGVTSTGDLLRAPGPAPSNPAPPSADNGRNTLLGNQNPLQNTSPPLQSPDHRPVISLADLVSQPGNMLNPIPPPTPVNGERDGVEWVEPSLAPLPLPSTLPRSDSLVEPLIPEKVKPSSTELFPDVLRTTQPKAAPSDGRTFQTPQPRALPISTQSQTQNIAGGVLKSSAPSTTLDSRTQSTDNANDRGVPAIRSSQSFFNPKTNTQPTLGAQSTRDSQSNLGTSLGTQTALDTQLADTVSSEAKEDNSAFADLGSRVVSFTTVFDSNVGRQPGFRNVPRLHSFQILERIMVAIASIAPAPRE